MTCWPRRGVLALGVISLAVLGGQPAWADTTVSLDPATLPVLAQVRTCDEPQARPGSDLWIFEVRDTPGALAGDLRAFSATFLTGTGEVVTATTEASTIPAPAEPSIEPTVAPSGVASASPSSGPTAPAGTPVPVSGLEGHRAWATTPAGWRLTAAAADITGAAGRLDLVESCSAAVPLIPAPHVLPAPAITSTKPPAASVIGATVQKGGAGVSISPTRPRTDAPPPFAPAAPAALPTTGTDVAGMLTLGTSLSLAGVLLLIVRRQRIRAAARRVAAEDIRSAIVVTWHD